MAGTAVVQSGVIAIAEIGVERAVGQIADHADVAAGRPDFDDLPVRLEMLDVGVLFGKAVLPQLVKDVRRRVAVAPGSLDPVMACDLQDMVSGDLSAQGLVEQIPHL